MSATEAYIQTMQAILMAWEDELGLTLTIRDAHEWMIDLVEAALP